MATFKDKIQILVDEVYDEWQKEENRGKGKWDILNNFSDAHQIAVVFGNFNYQVGNGGIEQWIYNGYFHDDAEKLTEYLETGAKIDERCRTILDSVYKLSQYAQETGCDREGYYRDSDNVNSDSDFIGDMINGDEFNTWYYDRCDKDDWWEVVSKIINEVAPQAISVEVEKPRPIQVYIKNIHDYRIGRFTLPLPATPEELRPFFVGAEIKGWHDVRIREAYSDNIAGLSGALDEILDGGISPEKFNELNYLAARISELDGDAFEVFSAIVEQGRFNNNLDELINLTFIENLNKFDLIPADNPNMYGDFLVNMVAADNYAEAYNRLDSSEDEQDRALAKHIEKLEKYVDYAAWGRDAANEEGGIFTKKGLLVGGAEMQEFYKGEIPEQYRIVPDANIKPLVKMENMDILATIAKLHAVCGYDLDEAKRRLEPMVKGWERDFLLILNHREIHISPTNDVYKRGKLAFDTVTECTQNPDARFFVINIKRYTPEDVIGDFVELSGKGLLSNINHHAVSPDRIDAAMTNGVQKSFGLWEWANLDVSVSGQIEDFDYHYSNEDVLNAEKYFRTYRDTVADTCSTVDESKVLIEANLPYMDSLKLSHPYIVRIPNEVAKDILAHNDMDVFRLEATGAEKIPAINVVKPEFSQYQFLGIRHGDVDYLGKWAAGAVAEIKRQIERGEQNKVKSQETEL